MKKLIVVAALGLGVVSIGGTAFAGEVTGSGKGGPNGDGTTAIADHHASSICSFSGLDDGEEGGPAGPGHVQNWGHTPGREPGGFNPGDACRGNAEAPPE